MGEYADLAIEQQEDEDFRRLHSYNMVRTRPAPPTQKRRVARGVITVERYDQNKHWRTRDGRFMKPGEMDTGHLVNALRMMLRSSRWRRHVYTFIRFAEVENTLGVDALVRMHGNPYAVECIGLAIITYPVIREIVRVLDGRTKAWRTWL